MAHYVQLMTLTPDGRERMAVDPHHMVDARSSITMEGVETLGLYAVLGQYDFVGLVQALDNDVAARYSLSLGARVGAHIVTLPAVPVIAFEQALRHDPPDEGTAVRLDPQFDLQEPSL